MRTQEETLTMTRIGRKRTSGIQYSSSGWGDPLNHGIVTSSFDTDLWKKGISSSMQPRGRRHMAAVVEFEEMQAVSDDMWKSMTESVQSREQSLVGIYALHVSKSGGKQQQELIASFRRIVSITNELPPPRIFALLPKY